MLSSLLDRFASEGKEKEVAMIKRFSPVAWRHINLFGRYEFNIEMQKVDLEEMLRNIQIIAEML